MAVLALIVEEVDGDYSLGAHATARLGELGVTHVSVLRDDRFVVFVLEGWAFDAERSAEPAEAALLGRCGTAHVLRQLAHVSVVPTDPTAQGRIGAGD